MDMYTSGNTLKIHATNLPEFKALLSQAAEEANWLNETIRKLSFFTLDFSFEVDQAQTETTDSVQSSRAGRVNRNI